MDPTFLDEWEESHNFPRWALEGRCRLNRVIREFNAWQRKLVTGEADRVDALAVLAHVLEGQQTWGQRDGGSGWLEELDRMKVILDGHLSL